MHDPAWIGRSFHDATGQSKFFRLKRCQPPSSISADALPPGSSSEAEVTMSQSIECDLQVRRPIALSSVNSSNYLTCPRSAAPLPAGEKPAWSPPSSLP